MRVGVGVKRVTFGGGLAFDASWTLSTVCMQTRQETGVLMHAALLHKHSRRHWTWACIEMPLSIQWYGCMWWRLILGSAYEHGQAGNTTDHHNIYLQCCIVSALLCASSTSNLRINSGSGSWDWKNCMPQWLRSKTCKSFYLRSGQGSRLPMLKRTIACSLWCSSNKRLRRSARLP